MRKQVKVLWLGLGALIILAGCGGAGEPQTAQPIELTLTATDIAYGQQTIEVTAGQPLRVVLDNEGALLHDFSIGTIPLIGEPHAEAEDAHSEEEASHEEQMAAEGEEPDVHVAAVAGAHGVVEFTPSAAGEYEFYCTVPGHREAGMVGTLRVSSN